MRARRAVGRALLGTGAVVLLAAALWRPLAVPALVKFPTDLDQTTRYEGTFTIHVDPATAVPLGTPIELPLELERRIRTLPEESGAKTVVVQELVTYRIAGTEQHEAHQYVMDRRSMANRDDLRSWSFDPANVVDRDGSYRVNLPLGTDEDGSYGIWENEPGRAFAMEGLGRRAEREGLTLVEMEEVWAGVPVADVYRDELRKQGFALETTVDGVVHPLEFFRSNDGHALVEPRTGAIVDLLVSDEAISASVDGGEPFPVYSLHYGQTDESVREIARLTRTELARLELAEDRLPLLLAGAGLALFAAGGLVSWLPRRRAVPVVLAAGTRQF